MLDKNIKTAIPVTSPDYNSLKNSLKEFLANQEEYQDYNFDGSAFSVMLGVLSINSHYNAFYINQVANEAFLKTAVKRSSASLKAQDLGYIPTSIKSAVAQIQIEITPTLTPPVSGQYLIQNPIFTTRTANQIFLFYSYDDILITANDENRYISDVIKIFEGKKFLLTTSLIDLNLTRGLILPNTNIDTSSIRVLINDDGSSTYYPYEQSTNIVSQSSDDRLYYLGEDENGQVLLQFGDDVISKKPPVNSPIIIEYVVCSGSLANDISSFKLENTIPDSIVNLYVVNKSIGGAETESIDSIKANAPLFRTTQNRAVIDSDYKIILKKYYGYISDVLAYGGETIDPPRYGKVMLAIKLLNDLYLTPLDIAEIEKFIRKYMVTGLTPVILEPDYVFINLDTVVSYNKLIANISKEQMQQLVINSIYAYENSELNGFQKDLRYSVLIRQIDFSDKSIISNTTNLSLEKKITPNINKSTLISFSFNVQISDILSSYFKYTNIDNCYIADPDKTGILSIYYYNNGLIKITDIGNVSYETGLVNIPSITIQAINSQNDYDEISLQYYLSFKANIDNSDLMAKENIVYKFNKISVKVEELKSKLTRI